MTVRAQKVWEEVEIVAGYITYIDLVRPFIGEKKIVSTGMRQEIDRCREVVRLAQEGNSVALVSSGDAGIYGMAGILIECLQEAGCIDMPLEIIPGVTAANAAASQRCAAHARFCSDQLKRSSYTLGANPQTDAFSG